MLESDEPIVRDVDALETPDGTVITADEIFGDRRQWIEKVRDAANHRILALSLTRVKATAYPRAEENDIFVAITFPRSDFERCLRDASDGLRCMIQGVCRIRWARRQYNTAIRQVIRAMRWGTAKSSLQPCAYRELHRMARARRSRPSCTTT